MSSIDRAALEIRLLEILSSDTLAARSEARGDDAYLAPWPRVNMPTYYLKNVARRTFPGLNTATTRRALRRIEQAGQVTSRMKGQDLHWRLSEGFKNASA